MARLGVATATCGLILAACGSGGTASSSSAKQGAQRTSAQTPTDIPATDAPQANVSADLGFRPDANGFSFPNYGNDVANLTNLTPAEMVDIFGTQVCSDPTASLCSLTPPAQAWMDQQNMSMRGGHCQGMSVTALLFYKGALKPSDYGGDTVPALTIDGNGALQRRIAESFQYQYFPGVIRGTIGGTPVQVLNALTKALQYKTTTYGLGIFKADHTGGHEITPIAVADRGNGVAAILVYDNNYPKAIRELDVDTTANTWQYVGSTNPAQAESDYKGDATTQTLNIDPLEPGQAKQPCPFCDQTQPAAHLVTPALGNAADTSTLEDIYLEGNPDSHAHLLITDPHGRRLGYVGSTFVNEIPGALVDYPKLNKDFAEAEEPEYYVPTGIDLTITVDGSPLTSSDDEEIGLIGPGDDLFVDVSVAPGSKDVLEVNADRTELTYRAGADQNPSIQFGSDYASSDFEFTVTPAALANGSTLALSLTDTDLTIDARALGATQGYDVEMLREDRNGNDLTFKHRGLSIPGGGSAALAYSGWDTHGSSIPVTIRSGGSSRQQDLSDQG